MSVFSIYVDGEIFYHPDLSSLAITKAQVKEDAESIDSLSLSVPFSHPYLDKIRPMQSVIVCKKDSKVVFEGRAVDDGSDFYNTHTFECESCLAYLKDTIQPPFDYSGSLKGLFEMFISEHNKNVEDKKKFVVGNITVTDSNDYISYSSTEYLSTMEAIKTRLTDTHGGYLSVRYEDGNRYLDYLADFNEYSLQTVEYGKNLLDVKITRDHTERATALIPLGAKISDEENSQRVDISSVNGGKNYIYDSEAVKETGYIWATEVWEDVTLPGNLLTKGKTRLKELTQGITSMELTIVDESDAGADISDIHAREYVICKSPPHGIDGRYLCLSKTTDYLNPENNTITIGAKGVRLTSATVKQSNSLQNISDDLSSVMGRVEKIDSAKMYRVEVTCEGVNIFRDKGQTAVLRCRVYSWDKDITGKLDDKCFLWHKISGDGESDTDWDELHKGFKSVSISTEDVQDNASFYCEVQIQN